MKFDLKLFPNAVVSDNIVLNSIGFKVTKHFNADKGLVLIISYEIRYIIKLNK